MDAQRLELTANTPFTDATAKRASEVRTATLMAAISAKDYIEKHNKRINQGLTEASEEEMAAELKFLEDANKLRQIHYQQWQQQIDETLIKLKAEKQQLIDNIDAMEEAERRAGKNVSAENMRARINAIQDQRLAEARALKAKLTDETLTAAQIADINQKLNKLKLDYLNEENKQRQIYMKQWVDQTNQLFDIAERRQRGLYEAGLITKATMDASIEAEQVKQAATLTAVLNLDAGYSANDPRKMSPEQRAAIESKLYDIAAKFIKEREERLGESAAQARISFEKLVSDANISIEDYSKIVNTSLDSTEARWDQYMDNVYAAVGGLPAAAASAFGQMSNSLNTNLAKMKTDTVAAVDAIIAKLRTLPTTITLNVTGGGSNGGGGGGSGSIVSYSGGTLTASGVYSAAKQGINLGLPGGTVFGTAGQPGSMTAAGIAYAAANGIRLWGQGGIIGYAAGGPVRPLYAALGMRVPGDGSEDNVPAMLTPGEFVIPTRGREGLDLLHALRVLANKGARVFEVGGSPSIAITVSGNVFRDRDDVDYLIERVKQEINYDVLWHNRNR
jgi:hypothetical protein